MTKPTNLILKNNELDIVQAAVQFFIANIDDDVIANAKENGFDINLNNGDLESLEDKLY